MRAGTIILLLCFVLCSCKNKTDLPAGSSRTVTAEVISSGEMHDNYGDRSEMSIVVIYKILKPSDLAGREVTMFYPADNGTNKTAAIGDVVNLEVYEAQLERQP